MTITETDLETYRNVKAELSRLARELCEASCGDMAQDGRCRGCSADTHPDWRRDAWRELCRRAREASAQSVRGLSTAEQQAQGERCPCGGTDEFCPCQNTPDAHLRKIREMEGRP